MNDTSVYWESFYKEGLAYGNRVLTSGRSGNLNPEVIHGLAAMANEKLLMALLLYHGIHPEGHTFFDLIHAVSHISAFDDDLKNALLKIDDILPLCSLTPAQPVSLTIEDIDMIINTVSQTRNYVDNALGYCG